MNIEILEPQLILILPEEPFQTQNNHPFYCLLRIKKQKKHPIDI